MATVDGLRALLETKISAEKLGIFEDDDFQKLIQQRYVNLAAFENVQDADLSFLPVAVKRALLSAFPTQQPGKQTLQSTLLMQVSRNLFYSWQGPLWVSTFQ